jgi:hypothetical protein
MKIRLAAILFVTGVFCIHTLNAEQTGVTSCEEEAKKVTHSLLKQLKGALVKEIQKSGPAGAISVCKELAPKLVSDISMEKGWKVTRVSLKPRNPLLGTADAWEQMVLKDFETRLGKGEAPGNLEVSEIVREPQGNYYRYMKALVIQSECLMCHGSPETIPSNIKKKLAAEYPHDKAIGYSAGQVRGAVSIKKPL